MDKKTKQKNKKAEIEFNGLSSIQVSGSSYIVRYDDVETMLDCGFAQYSNIQKQWQMNTRNFRYSAKKIDNIIISHLHLDHYGLLPILFARGCNAKVFISKGSKQLLKTLLISSMKIMESEYSSLRKINKKLKNPYSIDDIDRVISNVKECEVNTDIVIGEKVSFKFLPAYHIASSNQILLTLGEHKTPYKKILYTGDLGNVSIEKDYVAYSEPTDADIIIGETTYAQELKSDVIVSQRERDSDMNIISTAIQKCSHRASGSVLIPIFSMQRLQEIMTLLYEINEKEKIDIPIIVDTPLGININNSFSKIISKKSISKWNKVKDWKQISYVSKYNQTKEYSKNTKSRIILSASAFCEGGRVLDYLPNIVTDKNSTVIFVGYSSEDSIAGKIKKDKIFSQKGIDIPCICDIITLQSFTSHMQYNDLLKYYSDIKSDIIFLVHGDDKTFFKKDLEQTLKANGKRTKVKLPKLNEKIKI